MHVYLCFIIDRSVIKSGRNKCQDMVKDHQWKNYERSARAKMYH